jgi:hypothetical protein
MPSTRKSYFSETRDGYIITISVESSPAMKYVRKIAEAHSTDYIPRPGWHDPTNLIAFVWADMEIPDSVLIAALERKITTNISRFTQTIHNLTDTLYGKRVTHEPTVRSPAPAYP